MIRRPLRVGRHQRPLGVDAAFSDLGLDPATLPPSQLTDPQTGQARIHILAQLMRLRRAACDPRLVSPELGQRLVAARQQGASILLLMGAHVIRAGVARAGAAPDSARGRVRARAGLLRRGR